MASEWVHSKVGDVAEINPEAIGREWPFPYIRYIDISSVGEGTILETPQMINLAEAPSRAKRLVRQGDTVLSSVRPNRRSMFFASGPSPDWVVSTGFVVLRPRRDRIDPRYLYACVFDRQFTEYLVLQRKVTGEPPFR